MLKRLLIVSLLLLGAQVQGQYNFLDLERRIENRYTEHLKTGSVVHLSVRPYQKRDHATFNADSLNQDRLWVENEFTSKWLGNALLNDHFLTVKQSDFDLSIDPVLIFEGGVDQNGNGQNLAYRNTRGLRIQGRIGDKVFFRSGFL